jgi:hypothetical protein
VFDGESCGLQRLADGSLTPSLGLSIKTSAPEEPPIFFEAERGRLVPRPVPREAGPHDREASCTLHSPRGPAIDDFPQWYCCA